MEDRELDETTSDFEDEDTLEYAFDDDEDEATFEWDGQHWTKVA